MEPVINCGLLFTLFFFWKDWKAAARLEDQTLRDYALAHPRDFAHCREVKQQWKEKKRKRKRREEEGREGRGREGRGGEGRKAERERERGRERERKGKEPLFLELFCRSSLDDAFTFRKMQLNVCVKVNHMSAIRQTPRRGMK